MQRALLRDLILSWFYLSTIMSGSNNNAEGFAGSASSSADGGGASNGSSSGGEIPQLPPPDPNSSKDVPTIQLGETIRFEEWGPVILQTDGSMRRIDNWEQLSEREKEVTWKRISKRNEQRRQQLLEAQQQQSSENGGEEEGKEL